MGFLEEYNEKRQNKRITPFFLIFQHGTICHFCHAVFAIFLSLADHSALLSEFLTFHISPDRGPQGVCVP